MTTKTHGIRIALAAGLFAATLGGCSRSEPDEAPVTENASYQDEAPAETTNFADEVQPAPVAPEVKAEAPPAPEIAPDVQVQDDADATGMTARVTRDGSETNAPAADTPTTNETETE